VEDECVLVERIEDAVVEIARSRVGFVSVGRRTVFKVAEFAGVCRGVVLVVAGYSAVGVPCVVALIGVIETLVFFSLSCGARLAGVDG